MRLSNCCNVEVQNKYKCPACGKICKSREVDEQAESIPVIPDHVKQEEVISVTPDPAPVTEKVELEKPMFAYILAYYMGCEGIISFTTDRIHYSYQNGSMVTLNNYLMDFVNDGLVEFRPVLHGKEDITELDKRHLAAFKREWSKEHYFLDKDDVESYWMIAEKNFLRSRAYDMDELIEAGRAIHFKSPYSGPELMVTNLEGPVIYATPVVEEFENSFYALHDEERQSDNRAEIDLIDNQK